jgi:hypothetical protein
MAKAVCFKCGSQKHGALLNCPSCQAMPRDNQEVTLSLALSEPLSSASELEKYSTAIRNSGRPAVPGAVLAAAAEALSDPQLRELLAERRAASPSPLGMASHQQPKRVNAAAPPIQHPRQVYSLQSSALHRSPFAVLGATIRDDRRAIVELAENKSLELDHDECQRARSELTNTRTRLLTEIAWLPGVSPRRATECLQLLSSDALAVRDQTNLPTLAKANLWSSALSAVSVDHDDSDLSEFIVDFAFLVDELDADEVLRDINEDRQVSGFPIIQSIEQIESALGERRKYYREAVKDCLDKFPPARLVNLMTELVDTTTYSGEESAPSLVDDLVDSYETETRLVLQSELENINTLVGKVRAVAGRGESAVNSNIDELIAVARNWDKIAQPIQLSAKARGTTHAASFETARVLRDLAIDLFNDNGLLEQSKRLTELSQELFAELPEFAEHLERDAEALSNLALQKAQAEADHAQWERDIRYEVDVGAVFKETLKISSAGVSWKGKNYPLDAITRVRWGGVSHSVNGIPTGTNFTVAFGDRNSEAVVHIRRKETYQTFVDKLWRAVGVRLISEMLQTLKAGRSLSFGRATVFDDKIQLERHKFLGANEPVMRTWSQVQIWNADGSFFVGDKDDKKVYIGLSYIDVANTHLLEQIIRMKFKKAGSRLSDLIA